MPQIVGHVIEKQARQTRILTVLYTAKRWPTKYTRCNDVAPTDWPVLEIE